MKLTCSACQRLLTIDETKLPMREVSFPCPACKAKLVVDRRFLEQESDPEPQQVAPPPPAPALFEEEHDDDDMSEIALIAGVDDALVRQAARDLGFKPVLPPSIEAARDLFVQRSPRIVFLRPEKLTPPPLSDFSPLLSVSPVDRRKGFFVLVGDNVRTFDGNAAFLYGVNLTLATRDLGSIVDIYREAQIDHLRMFGPLLELM